MKTREIKFRAWDSEENKMYYGVGVTPLKVIIYKDVGDKMVVPMILSEIGIDCDCLTLEQYTTWNDGNGDKIYVGDILKKPGGDPSVFEVIFKRGCFCVKSNHVRSSYTMFDFFERTRSGNLQCKKIGNIHQNPELLNK